MSGGYRNQADIYYWACRWLKQWRPSAKGKFRCTYAVCMHAQLEIKGKTEKTAFNVQSCSCFTLLPANIPSKQICLGVTQRDANFSKAGGANCAFETKRRASQQSFSGCHPVPGKDRGILLKLTCFTSASD